ncbi:hypothetical protein pipiens_011639 [Culex pipiens pipiens]|uniref:Gustatory receptor n=1 Tax=Culex pipiens pipiens TaxID=38569 RepID=A0ABD1D5K2_CULPP
MNISARRLKKISKPSSLPTAASCLAHFNLCCKLFGIIPLFTNLERKTARRPLYLFLNYLGLAASMTAYVAILRMSFRETIVQVINSSLMILIMEIVYRQYSIVGLVAVGQLLYESVGKITTILDAVDRELAQAGNTGTLVAFDRFVHRMIAFGFLAPFLLLALGAVFLNSHVDVKPEQFLVIATNLYVQCSYAFMLLHPIVTVLAVSLRFRRVDETLSSTGSGQNRFIWVQFFACLLVCGILMVWNYDYRYWNKWNSPVAIKSGIVMQTVYFCQPTMAIVAGFLLKSKTQRMLLKLHHFDAQFQSLTKQAINYRRQQSWIAIGLFGLIVISMCFMLSYNAFVNVYHNMVLPLKCLALYPPVSDVKHLRQVGLQLLNLAVIVASIVLNGYLLVSFSLESEVIKLCTGSILLQRMLDVYCVFRYVMISVVPIFAWYNLARTQRLLTTLEDVSRQILDLGCQRTFGIAESSAFIRSAQLMSLVLPGFCYGTFHVYMEARGFVVYIQVMFRAVKNLYFCTYTQLWLQPTLFLLLIRARYLALGRAMSFRPMEIYLKFTGLIPLFWRDNLTPTQRVLNWILFGLNLVACEVVTFFMLDQLPSDANFVRQSLLRKLISYCFAVVVTVAGFALADRTRKIFDMLHEVDREL